MIPTSMPSMRFPAEKEAEFQRRYHLRAGKHTQLLMILGLIIFQMGAYWGNYSWSLRALVIIGPILGWIWCEIKALHKFGQTVGTLAYIAFFWGHDYILAVTSSYYGSGSLSYLVMMNVFVMYTMLRLFFLPTIVAATTISISHLFLLSSQGADPETIKSAALGLLICNVIGMVTSYQLERNFRQMFSDKEDLTKQHAIQARLLKNILPEAFSEKLRNNFQDTIIDCPDVIVISADLANFTAYSATVSAGDLVAFLNDVYTHFDGLADRYKLTKIKTMGDAIIFVTGFHSLPDLDAAVNMALMMRTTLQDLAKKHETGTDIRIGIARGSCSAGVIGELRPKFDIWGPVIADAERMEQTAENGAIALSSDLMRTLSSTAAGRDLLLHTAKSQARLEERVS